MNIETKNVKFASTSVILRITLVKFNTVSHAYQGFTGLTSASAGLIISVIADNGATAFATYTSAGSTIEGITTLGTYAAPTATKIRFKEVDATNHPGLYEIQAADAVYAISNAKMLMLCVSGVTDLQDEHIEINLIKYDEYDSVRLGLTTLPNANAGANTGLPVVGTQVPNATAGAVNGLPTVDANNAVKVQSGTGANQISLTSGVVNTVATVTNGVTVKTNNDKTGYALSAAALTAIENQIWNALVASHTTAGSFGLRLGSTLLTDPLAQSVPGSYGAGTLGFIIGTNLNATVSSRSTLAVADVTTGVNSALDAADAELSTLPADSCSLRERLKFIYQYFRFKRTVTNVLETMFKANSSTSLGTAAVSNDGTTFQHNKVS